MPKIRVDYEDWEEADEDFDAESFEPIRSRHKTEEEVKESQKKSNKHRDAEAAKRKEFQEEDE